LYSLRTGSSPAHILTACGAILMSWLWNLISGLWNNVVHDDEVNVMGLLAKMK